MKLKVFYTPMCGKCPAQKDTVEGIASDRDDVEYKPIDATENTDEANQYSVRSFPTTVLLDDSGGVVAQFTGLTQEDEIRSAM